MAAATETLILIRWTTNPPYNLRGYSLQPSNHQRAWQLNKDNDLLPWIFAALSIATVAVAFAVGSTRRTVSEPVRAPVTASIQAAIEPAPAQVSTPAPTQPQPDLTAAQIPTMSPSEPPSGQIWQCTTNGQKTFSNNPCGENSALLQIRAVNGMDPTPVLAAGRSYQAPSNYAPEYPSPPEYSYGSMAESAGNSYPVLIGVPFNERRRPNSMHRPYRHDRGSQPRKY
jgi:hypothetical protein